MRFNRFLLLIFVQFYFVLSQDKIYGKILKEVSDEQQVHHEKKLFGKYAINLSLGFPSFPKVNFYNQLYGSTGYYPSINTDFLFYQTGNISFGGGWQFSYYKDSGSPANQTNSSTPSAADITLSPESSHLTLVPFEFQLNTQFAPLGNRDLIFKLWIGLEEMYFQEVRLNEEEGDNEDGVPMNTGRHNSLTFGLSTKISMTLFGNFSSSTVNFIRLRLPHLSPFVEVSQKIDGPRGGRVLIAGIPSSKVNYSKTVFGIAFNFMSTR